MRVLGVLLCLGLASGFALPSHGISSPKQLGKLAKVVDNPPSLPAL